MTRARPMPALLLAAGLLAVSNGSSAQQPPGSRPGAPPGTMPNQPVVGPRAAPPGREAAVPLVPKSVGAFVALSVSDLAEHPDLKPVFADLALGENYSDRTKGLWFDGHCVLFPTTLKPLEFWPFIINGGELTPHPDDGRQDRVRPDSSYREERRTDRMPLPVPDRDQRPTDRAALRATAIDPLAELIQQGKSKQIYTDLMLTVIRQKIRYERSEMNLILQQILAAEAAMAADAATAAFAAGTATANAVVIAEAQAKRAGLVAAVLRLRRAGEQSLLTILQAELERERKAARPGK